MKARKVNIFKDNIIFEIKNSSHNLRKSALEVCLIKKEKISYKLVLFRFLLIIIALFFIDDFEVQPMVAEKRYGGIYYAFYALLFWLIISQIFYIINDFITKNQVIFKSKYEDKIRYLCKTDKEFYEIKKTLENFDYCIDALHKSI